MDETQIIEHKKKYPTITQSFGIVGIIILAMILFSPVILFKELIGEEVSTLIYYILAMGCSFLVIDRIKNKKLGKSNYTLGFVNARILIFISIATIALQIGVTSPIVYSIPMPEFIKVMFIEMSQRTGPFSFLMIVIAAPILEELIFRGVMLDGLLKSYSPIKSILISSIFFGLVHLNPWQFVAALVIGIFSGWVYYHTRNLMFSIVIHLVNNLFAFLSMYFTDPEEMMRTTLTETYGGILSMVLSILSAILVAVVCIYFLKKELTTKIWRDENEPLLPD